MFFTSSLLPTGNASQCDTDCSGGYFGWTNPVPIPGQFGVSSLWSLPNIWVGANPLGDTGDLFSFDGGRYQQKFLTPQLVPGRWRFHGVFWYAASGIGLYNKNPVYNQRTPVDYATVGQITDAIFDGTLSLVDKNDTLIQNITMARLPETSGAAWENNNGTNIGGVDGCGHLFDQAVGYLGLDVPWVRAADVIVPQRKVSYLKCVPTSNDVTAMFQNVDFGIPFGLGLAPDAQGVFYQIHGFYMDGCRCGGFLESSYAMGY